MQPNAVITKAPAVKQDVKVNKKRYELDRPSFEPDE